MRKLLFAVLLLVAPIATGTDYYVSSTATSGGTGTFTNPWTLGTAIGCGQLPHGGDTIWVRGGTYVGHFTLCTSGNSTSPLIVRNYNGEHVIIDGSNISGTSPIILLTGNGYVWWWGMEMLSTDPVRVSAFTLSTPPDITRPDAFDCYQRTNPDGTPVLRPGFKIINNIIHDDRQGIGNWEECTNLEFVGNLSFHHGWTAPDRGHGHGTYSHNTTPSQKKQSYNIIFSNFGLGIQIYGSSDIHLDNFEVDHNIIFNAGGMENTGGSHDLLYGGYFGPAYVGANIHDNSIYRTGQSGNQDFDLGYVAGAGLINPIVINNRVAASVNNIATSGMTFTGNTIWSADVNPSTMPATFPSNTWNGAGGGRITNTTSYYPNPYESGRCNVAVFNWTLATGVGLDMSQCGLTTGVNYEVHAATNYYGALVTTFTYNPLAPTVNVNTSTSALPVQMPVGCPDTRFHCPPSNTAPEFCVYVIQPVTGGAATPTPTITNTFTLTPTPTVTNTPTKTFTASNTPTKTNTPLFTDTPTATPSNTSTPTVTNTPIPGGCTYIEAESADLVIPAATLSDALASGGLAVQSGTPNSGTATFHIDGGAGGSVVYVWHRILATDGNHDSYYVLFNNDPAGDATHIDDVAEQTWSPNWQWTRLVDRTKAGCNPALPLNPASCQPGFTLISGDNTLRIRWRDILTELDIIAVCPNQSVIPQPTATPTPTSTSTPTLTPTPTFTPSNTPGSLCVTTTATPP